MTPNLLLIGLATGMCLHAGAPMSKTQPGYYRMMLGNFEITALNDGVVAYPTSQALPTATPEQIHQGLSDMALSDPVDMSYSAYLINTGPLLVLIDTGTGGKLDDNPGFHGAGHLLANLRAAGYRPEQVDEIYITHTGPDHIGGLTIDGKRAFPNAIVRAAKNEVDFFLNPTPAAPPNRAKARIGLPFFKGLFEPYIQAGKYKPFEEDISLSPGIRALATPGHTPGHTSYIVESEGQTMIVWGDLLHVGALQFTDPSLPIAFDEDPKQGIVQRSRVLKLAADHGYWIAGSHLSFPGLGHVRSEQGHYVWVPVNYSIPH
jgi:glyoxylase-like metal-dependent hydrolase (beta-lactamase superfamily II)